MKLSDTSVKIYVAKRNGTTQVESVELEDHIIPAATAVILQADDAKALTLEATDEVGDKAKAGATYDLTGRRVQQTAKGQVYVRDGKKFVQQQNSSYV